MKFLDRRLIKKHQLFIILIPLIFILQSYLLRPHLQYGFDDTADQYIVQFRQLVQKSPNLIQFVKNSMDTLPLLWLHEYYYMGILNYFLGDNWVLYHQTTHFFKSRVLKTIATPLG